jgi:hypothetical protein
MTFKKRGLASKLWLKYTDRPKYKQYKWEHKNYGQEEVNNYFIGNDRLNTQDKIVELCKTVTTLNIVHSGNAGDVIYALPTIKKIYEVTGISINLYLKTGKPLVLSGYAAHPLGTVMLNEKMVNLLAPLINAQSYIATCEIYNGQQIHVDLDFFRAKLFSLDNTNIARWCSYITGVTPQLWKSWLTVDADQSYANTIIVARSERYRNSFVDYSFLKNYDNLVFIGVEAEYEDMRKAIPNIKWVQVDNFLQLARIIAGCKLFIGNQSFPFSIAEALKVPRILEIYYHTANVIPEGPNAHDFFFQDHFESLVKELSA